MRIVELPKGGALSCACASNVDQRRVSSAMGGFFRICAWHVRSGEFVGRLCRVLQEIPLLFDAAERDQYERRYPVPPQWEASTAWFAINVSWGILDHVFNCKTEERRLLRRSS